MKRCEKCKVTVNSNKKQCPVCFDELEVIEDVKEQDLIYATAKQYDNVSGKNVFLNNLFIFLTITILSVSIFINFMTDPTVLWSLVVGISLVYLWILIKHTIISKRGVFEKVLFQFLGILGVILATNYVSGGQDWFWNFVVPSAGIATTTVLAMVLLINSKRSDFALSFLLMSFIIIAISATVLLIDADSFRLLNLINLLYSGLFALAILIFGFKTIKRSFHKTMHI